MDFSVSDRIPSEILNVMDIQDSDINAQFGLIMDAFLKGESGQIDSKIQYQIENGVLSGQITLDQGNDRFHLYAFDISLNTDDIAVQYDLWCGKKLKFRDCHY